MLRRCGKGLLFGVPLMVLPFPIVVQAQNRVPMMPPSAPAPLVMDEERVLTVAELQGIAVSRHPQLYRLHQNIQSAHGDWIQNGLYPNPEVSFDLIEVGLEREWGKQEVGLSQEIVTNGKIRLSQDVSRQDIAIARQELTIQYMALSSLVKVRVYELLAAQKTLEFQKGLLEINEKSLQIVESMHAASEVSVVDVLQARTKKNEATLEFWKAQNEESLCWNRLATAVGVPQLPQATIEDTLDTDGTDIQSEQAWSRIVAASPQILLAQKNVHRAGAALRYEKAAAKPNFTVGGAYGYDQGTNDSYGTVGISVPLPLRNRNQGNIQKAAAGIAAANSDIEILKLQLREKFLAVYTQYKNAKQSVESYSGMILPDIQKNLEMSEKGYQRGELHYLDFLTAQQDYIKSQQSYIQSLKDLAVAKTLIDGLLLVDAE